MNNDKNPFQNVRCYLSSNGPSYGLNVFYWRNEWTVMQYIQPFLFGIGFFRSELSDLYTYIVTSLIHVSQFNTLDSIQVHATNGSFETLTWTRLKIWADNLSCNIPWINTWSIQVRFTVTNYERVHYELSTSPSSVKSKILPENRRLSALFSLHWTFEPFSGMNNRRTFEVSSIHTADMTKFTINISIIVPRTVTSLQTNIYGTEIPFNCRIKNMFEKRIVPVYSKYIYTTHF